LFCSAVIDNPHFSVRGTRQGRHGMAGGCWLPSVPGSGCDPDLSSPRCCLGRSRRRAACTVDLAAVICLRDHAMGPDEQLAADDAGLDGADLGPAASHGPRSGGRDQTGGFRRATFQVLPAE
jgi:hypothetical protein